MLFIAKSNVPTVLQNRRRICFLSDIRIICNHQTFDVWVLQIVFFKVRKMFSEINIKTQHFKTIMHSRSWNTTRTDF